MTQDLQAIASELKVSQEQVEKTIDLLEQGNTIPFITRFRKDETGGLRASQIQLIQQRHDKFKALNERKSFIIKSIESQGKLTDELKEQIEKSKSTRSLEDIYLPFKPKQQSLAMTAKQQGLDPLATDISEGDRPDTDLASRATDFVRPEKNLNSVDEVIAGVGYILAERISERADLRDQLRKIVWSTGRLVVSTIEPENKESGSESTEDSKDESKVTAEMPAGEASAENQESEPQEAAVDVGAQPEVDSEGTEADAALVTENVESQSSEQAAESKPAEALTVGDADNAGTAEKTDAAEAADPESVDSQANEQTSVDASKTKKKKKKKKKPEHPFQDYANFDQPLNKIPNHRKLAINRGERAGLLKVRIECNKNKLSEVVNQSAEDSHPFATFLRDCAQDACNRLIMPSIEREVRRELTETAEEHAVKVFALNLRNLLLQPPVRSKRVLAIDPGYKRGCTIVALDESGNLLESERMAVVGNQAKKDDSKAKIVDFTKRHQLNLIAIGNGTACRQTEEIVSDAIQGELKELGVQYVIVNEAGASFYSTSEIGAEELPEETPLVRSAISIGRRLINPLSELVKISPANIGVGLYQHDVKAKHLNESLLEVVRDCVNLVGVDVNSASPSLLAHVAGLNQLTARRIVEYRNEKGQFKNREQLREVSGVGDSTFVQAAGFLRVYGGENPLDETSIHPESYELASKILAKVNATPDQLPKRVPEPVEEKPTSDSETPVSSGSKPEPNPLKDSIAALDFNSVASEFSVGSLLATDVIRALKHPSHDPRRNFGGPIFRSGIIKVDDLKPEMKLRAQVVNVVDFGVFVDIGLGVSCLVHISQLSNQFMRDLHQHYCVGDRLTVWVKEIDKEKKRVQLTAVAPGAKPRGARGKDNRKGGPRGQNRGNRPGGGGGGKRNFRKDQDRRHSKPKKKKPVKPITDEMLAGDKPMRSFSDLAQFFDKSKDKK